MPRATARIAYDLGELLPEVRPLLAAERADGRVFVDPRPPVSTAVLRDATHWDHVVASLGFDRLRRHDLRHTGPTWMADAGVPLHHLRKIAGHGSQTTTSVTCTPTRNRSPWLSTCFRLT